MANKQARVPVEIYDRVMEVTDDFHAYTAAALEAALVESPPDSDMPSLAEFACMSALQRQQLFRRARRSLG